MPETLPSFVTIPLEDFDRLMNVLKSHLHRDTSLRDLISGLEPHWLCEESSALLRNEAPIPDDGTETRVRFWTEDVPREEQLELIKQWIADGGE